MRRLRFVLEYVGRERRRRRIAQVRHDLRQANRLAAWKGTPELMDVADRLEEELDRLVAEEARRARASG